MEFLTGLLNAVTGTLGTPMLWSIVALLLAKFLPNKVIDHLGHSIGVFVTLGLSRILPFWSKLEEWLIDGLAVFVTGIIKGLRSDNPSGDDT